MDDSQNPFPSVPEPTPGEPITASVVPEAETAETKSGVAGRRWSDAPMPTKPEQPPVGWRELVALLAIVVLCDLTIYRGHGFAGYSLLFLVAPFLFCLGAYKPRFDWVSWTLGAMLVVVAAKLVWCGSWLLVAVGFVLVIDFTMALSGQRPFVVAAAVFASGAIRAACDRLNFYGRRMLGFGSPKAGTAWLNVILPLAALLIFGMIFIVANPDVLGYVSESLEIFFNRLHDWLVNFSMWEVVFWIGVLWISVGLMRPLIGRFGASEEPDDERLTIGPSSPAPLYTAYRNTLVTVILLFAVYLIFEFQTLWFHEFPKGFYYSGYAHEGAAWLMFALALATAILSLVFNGATLQDPRLGQLRGLAWIWSAQNFVLAAAVYHRLGIYIGFNGMTRMRIVGMFGMTAVVVGFALVLWKIAKNRSFAWLVRRHLLTVAVAVFLFALTPLDAIVVSYNVRQILAGDLKPSVQITEHPISSEGITRLAPLLECKDAIIREGIRAMLSQRAAEAEALAAEQKRFGWTAYQMADRQTLEWFRVHRAEFDTFKNADERQEVYGKYKDYAYQWY